VGEESIPLGHLLSAEDVSQDSAEARVMLQPIVRSLSERDRSILHMRFFLGLTQREIADEIGVTQMQVSRLLTRIYADLRTALGDVRGPAA
jgi:RNA polymerase sigma-B factor